MTVWLRNGQWWNKGIVCAATCTALFVGNSASAQIVPDRTLGGESSVVVPNTDIKNLPSDRIDGGAIRGANLFHSFQEFNVRDGRGAYFNNPAGIENIFSRVTGTNVSNIFGKLGVLGNANLFLLNPNGIIFGPNASLDVRGSFVGSTGNSFNFGGGKEFSARNPTAPPLLTVNVPLGVQFNQEQPRAIVNSGNLSVGVGQNLNLTGGTVVSTGQLSAPGGQVAVAAVPGGSVVNLSPSAQLVNIEASSAVPSVGSSATVTDLLGSSDERSHPGLTVNSNGQVSLVGSGLPVVDGDVVARNVTAQTGILTANHNLTLVESQLNTTGDLNLLAGDTVRVRDSVTNPFVAEAGGQLLVQGRQGVDIFALNHPSSGLFSGGDMVLRSANTVGGDAHYWAGGNFRIEKLDGSLGGLFSPYDPIIRASGDVSFQSYTGGSLHILAGGSVTINGKVEITGADQDFGLPEQRVTLSDGTQITIDGRSSPTLDIRAGTTDLGTPEFTPVAFPGNGNVLFPNNPGLPITTGDISNGTRTEGAKITIGSIDNKARIVNGQQVSGQIFLTNQYQRNPNLPNGSIEITGVTGEVPISTAPASIAAFGNPVTIDSKGDVRIAQGINSSIDNGIAGDIKILSGRDITVGLITSSTGNGDGGNITLSADRNITTGGNVNSFVSNRVAGNSGDISIISRTGNINTVGGEINSTTPNGDAGDIALIAPLGNITTAKVSSFVDARGTGNGGNITLRSGIGNINTVGGEISSTTANGNAGDIELIAPFGNITTANVSSFVGAGGTGNGGNITLRSGVTNGEITVGLAPGYGQINTIQGTINSANGNGVAGNITFNAASDIRSGKIQAFSNSSSRGDANQFNRIKLNSLQGSVFLDNVQLTTTNNGINDAGDIIIKGRNIQITNSTVKTNSENTNNNISTEFPSQAGDIDVTSTNGNIEITNSTLTATTQSQLANPGNISLRANMGKVLIQQNSLISTTIEQNAGVVKPDNSSDSGDFGNINIFGNSVEIRGSEVTATSASLAPAGNISVIARDSFILSGTSFVDFRTQAEANNPTSQTVQRRPGLFAQATVDNGTAGEVDIYTNKLRVENGAQVTVSSREGQAGNVVVLAKEISLNNGAIQATTGRTSTKLGDGANIVLLGTETTTAELNILSSLIAKNELRGESLLGSSLDFLHLSNESFIAANAREDAIGGNVAIKTRVLLGLPPTRDKGSDISANAQRGNGGEIAIDTTPLGIYGIEFRPKNTPLNDITASSETGRAGIVSIRLPDVDPRRGLFQLPEDLGDSSRFIDPSCPVGGKRARSQFVVTGRGGLPPNPSSFLNSDILSPC